MNETQKKWTRSVVHHGSGSMIRYASGPWCIEHVVGILGWVISEGGLLDLPSDPDKDWIQWEFEGEILKWTAARTLKEAKQKVEALARYKQQIEAQRLEIIRRLC